VVGTSRFGPQDQSRDGPGSGIATDGFAFSSAAIEAPATLVVGDVVAAERVLARAMGEEKAGTPAETRPKQVSVGR